MNNKEEKRIYKQSWEVEKKVEINSQHKNVILFGELGCFSIILYDNSGNTPVSNTEYRIKGPNGKEYSGTTDETGYLYHPDIPIDDYDLTVEGVTVKIPVVLNKEEHHLQRLIDYEIP